MPQRKSKATVPFNSRLDPEIYEALDKHSAEKKKTKKEIIETALRKHLKIKKK